MCCMKSTIVLSLTQHASRALSKPWMYWRPVSTAYILPKTSGPKILHLRSKHCAICSVGGELQIEPLRLVNTIVRTLQKCKIILT